MQICDTEIWMSIKTVIDVHVYSGFLRKWFFLLVFHHDQSLINSVPTQRVNKEVLNLTSDFKQQSVVLSSPSSFSLNSLNKLNQWFLFHCFGSLLLYL